MPNHVRTKVKVRHEDNNTLCRFFNRYVTHLPGEEKKAGYGDHIIVEMEMLHFPDFEKIIPMPDNVARGDLTVEEMEAGPNWYNWSIANWGTKWNSYSGTHNDVNLDWDIEDFPTGRRPWILEFEFETAWAYPAPIMLALSEQNPELEIEAWYADEDFGYNTGYVRYKGGEIIDTHIPKGGTNDAYEMAFIARPEYKENYQFIDGEWKYVEEAE